MSNTITGNELVTPIDGTYAVESRNAGDGLTIRQLALKDFMCEFIKHHYDAVNAAEAAEQFVTAYINQLNTNTK